MKKLIALAIASTFAGASLASFAAPTANGAKSDTVKATPAKKARAHHAKHKAAAKTDAGKKADEGKKS